MYSENDFRFYTELYHHGILGQKWGVRNGPPYPLAPSAHNSSEKKAGWKSSLTKAKENKGVSTKTEGDYNNPILVDERSRPLHWNNPLDKRVIETEGRHFPDGRHIYPPIASVIKDFEDAGMGNPYPGEVGFDGLYDRVNPGYGENGTTNNCPFVGAAMEVASRGYGVVARRSLGGCGATAFERWFNGAKTEYCNDWDELKNDILEDGDGASGVLQGYYGEGLGSGKGGHTLHWRNEGGDIIVADGQCHQEMNFDSVVDEYHFGSNGCIRTRLDNCEPNWQAMAEDGVLGVDNDARRWKDAETGDIYTGF